MTASKEDTLTDAEAELINDVIYEMDKMFIEIMEAAGDMESAFKIILNTSLYCIVKEMADDGVSELHVHELINNMYTTFHNEKPKP